MTDGLNLVDKRVEELRDEREKVVQCYRQIFNTESGRQVIKDLKKLTAYNTPLGAQSTETCNYILAQREMLMYILNMLEED